MPDRLFFVMLNTQDDIKVMPLVDANEEICMFITVNDAIASARNNILAESFGYEIFERGQGI